MATITNDFKQIVQEMAGQRMNEPKKQLVVRAGSIAEEELDGWLDTLKWDGLQVCIWIRADGCAIGTDHTPGNPRLLEGARLFGEGGDLELWRVGAVFHWRFVGEKDNAPQVKAQEDTAAKEQDLPWPGDDLNPVYCQPRKALLWGERKGDETQWFDDRVAGAQLTYPGMGKATRVRVCYEAYSQAGHVLFVWLKRLEAYHG